jgi:uncharacterized protein YeaO (DUF488 family)
MKTIHIKRVYDEPAPEDGYRVLVDRLWPRGVAKESAHVDLWLKDLAPSAALRKWFGHRPERWAEFKKRYFRELTQDAESAAIAQFLALKNKTITFLYAAKDTEHNNAVALSEYLQER